MASLAVLFMHNPSKLDEVLAAWHDAGAPEVTVIDCVGTRGVTEQARRDDLPLLPTVRALLQSDEAPRKAVLAIVPEVLVDPIVEATKTVLGDLDDPGNGIFFSLSVDRVAGLSESG